MRLETIALVGFSAIQASQAYNQAEARAKAITEDGKLRAKNKAKETVYSAARLKQSFLSGGLTLEGTPMSVLNETFTTGFEDVSQIATNANRSSNVAIGEGRTKALNSLKSSFSGFGGGSVGGFGNGFEQELSRTFAPGATSYGPQSPIWS